MGIGKSLFVVIGIVGLALILIFLVMVGFLTGSGNTLESLIKSPKATKPIADALNAIKIEVDASSIVNEMPKIISVGVDISQWGDTIHQTYFRDKLLQENNVKLIRTGLFLEQNVARKANNFDEYVSLLKPLDEAILAYKKAGADVILTIYGMPKWLSSRCQMISDRYKCDKGSVAPPRDYDEWSKFVSQLVRHYKNDIGVELMYEVWNEPDQNYIFSIDTFWTGTEQEYFKLYQYTVYGTKEVDKNAKIGGPASSVYDKGAIENFIKFASQQKLPIDFISFHTYIGWNKFKGTEAEYKEMSSKIRQWLRENGYNSNTPLIIDEWNYNAGFNRPREHDAELTASYIPYALKNMLNGGIDRHTFFHLADFTNTPQVFGGSHGIFTLSGVVKPSYNALQLVSKLSGKEENEPTNQLKVITSEIDYITVLASQTKDKKTNRILISNFVPIAKSNVYYIQNPREIKLTITNLTNGAYTINKYIISESHSNSCRYNKRTETKPSNRVCGFGGVIDKKVDLARKEAELLPKETRDSVFFYESNNSISRINEMEGVRLELVEQRDAIVDNSKYYESVVMQPYSVLLVELKVSRFSQ